MVDIISSIAELTERDEAWFVDIWGVMHNGVAPFTAAVAACRAFRARGGIVVLVSNAPRPAPSVVAALDRIGVPRDCYDAIQSSGDTARGMIAALGDAPVYHLGPDRDLVLFEGLMARRVAPTDARHIVCTGLIDDETETADTYRSELTALAHRRVPMICANPDLVVERGGKIIPCAGAVAALYEQLGALVAYAGKPHLPIYKAAFALVDQIAGRTVPHAHILAIGDGVRTDIVGAAAAGIRSVYIASAVHLGEVALDASSLARLFPAATGVPIAAMTELVW